jgi:hypothetical protein
MPSNAMKLSQLEAHLAQLRAEHGDLDVVFASPRDGALIAVDGRNINVTAQALGKTLPAPAVTIGLWLDPAGRLTNMPGAAYQATADDGGWSYDRAAAPEGVDLRVWKRYGGEDVGRREGDKWFVREGAAEWPRRPVEIIPAGVLGWRAL